MIEYRDWKIRNENDDILGQILRFEDDIESNRIVNKSLDGSIYVQTIGSGVHYAKIDIFSSLEEKKQLTRETANGSPFYVAYKDSIYFGYFEEQPQWETVYPGMWYSTTINFLIESYQTI